jgi:hypothetical protein
VQAFSISLFHQRNAARVEKSWSACLMQEPE